jgi:hypothetical protein
MSAITHLFRPSGHPGLGYDSRARAGPSVYDFPSWKYLA